MKKLLFVVLLMVFMISCDDDSNPTNNGQELGEMTATVNGDNFQADNAVYQPASEQIIGSDLDITSQVTQTISLTFIGKVIEVGTYEEITGNYVEIPVGSEENTQVWSTVLADVELTTVTDSEIAGTFDFTAFNEDDETEKNISGEFRVSR